MLKAPPLPLDLPSHLPHEILDPLAGDGGDRMNQEPHLPERCAQIRNQGLTGQEIDLGQHHNLGFNQKLGTVLAELVIQRMVTRDSRPRVCGIGGIDEVDQDPGSLHVTEKVQAQSGSLMGALDEPRYIGNDKRPSLREAHCTQVRNEGSEWVVGDLGAGRGNLGYEGGFTGVGEADEAHLGEELQFEPDMPLFSCPSLLGKARRLATRGGEVHVPLPAVSTPGHHAAIPVAREIVEDLAAIPVSHLSPDRDQEGQVRTAFSRLLLTPAMGTSGRPEMSLEVKIEEGLLGIRSLEDHITALAAVTAVGTAPRHELFTSEAQAPITTIAAPNVNIDLVDKAHTKR